MGEVPLRRRLYRDRESGFPVFLLDRSLDFTLKKRLSLCLERRSSDFATQMSLRDAADRVSLICSPQLAI